MLHLKMFNFIFVMIAKNLSIVKNAIKCNAKFEKKFNFIIIFNMSLTCSLKTLMQSESYKILLQNRRKYRIPICNQHFKIFAS